MRSLLFIPAGSGRKAIRTVDAGGLAHLHGGQTAVRRIGLGNMRLDRRHLIAACPTLGRAGLGR